MSRNILRKISLVLRCLLTLVPFLIGANVMLFGVPGNYGGGHLDLIWMAIWFLSLLQILNYVDRK